MTQAADTNPAQMPVAVYRGRGDIGVENRVVPTPGPGHVLVEVSHCGICGSDLHLMVEGWGKPGLVGGHEFTGVIAAVGEGVAEWAAGDEIVGGASPKCGRCRRCLEGKPSQCENRSASTITDDHNGAFARYILMDDAFIDPSARRLVVARRLWPNRWLSRYGITRSGLTAGDSAMVIGAGPIGALTIAALVARGFDSVTAVEPGEGRRQLALDLGASHVFAPEDLEVYPMWEPERISPQAVDVVFECSGKKAAMEAGFNQLRRGGVLTLVGAGIEPPSFDPNRMILNELHVCGSFIYDADGFERALELLASGALPTDVLIDPVDVPLDLLGEAMSGLAEGRIAGKAMVVPRLSTDLTAPEAS